MPPRDQRSLALGRPLTPLSTEFLCGLWFSRGVFSATDATLGGAWGVPTPRDTCLARAARHWVRRGDGGPPGDRTPNPRILGPLLWLVVDSAHQLRVSQLRMLVVCGRSGSADTV